MAASAIHELQVSLPSADSRRTIYQHLDLEGHAMNALIESSPKVMLGKPVVAGTRITVEFILEELAAGKTMQGLVDSHPRLSLSAIRAALSYSAAVLRNDVVHEVVAA